MANVKVSALPSAEAITGTEYVPIVQAGASRKATVEGLKDYIAAGVTEKYPQRGVIFSKITGALASGDFTVNNGAAAFTGGNIVMSGGVSKTDWTRNAIVTRYKDSDNQVTLKVRFVLNNTSGAISAGKISYNTWYTVGLMAQLDCADGKVKFLPTGGAPAGNNVVIMSATGITITAGATYELTYQVAGGIAIISASRLNSDGSVAETVKIVKQFIYTTQLFIKGNTSQFAIATHGGQQTVTAVEISRQSRKGYGIAFGDSKTDDIGCTNYGDGYVNVFAQLMGLNINNWAGNGDRIEETKEALESAIDLEAEYVTINVLRNNVPSTGFGDTQKNYYRAFVAGFVSAGIPVFHFCNLPEPGFDQSAIVAWLIAEYGEANVLDLSDEFDMDSMLNRPNETIHPNSLGNIFTGQKIANSAKFRMFISKAQALTALRLAS